MYRELEINRALPENFMQWNEKAQVFDDQPAITHPFLST